MLTNFLIPIVIFNNKNGRPHLEIAGLFCLIKMFLKLGCQMDGANYNNRQIRLSALISYLNYQEIPLLSD